MSAQSNSLAAAIRSLVDKGLSNFEIAEQLECSANYVRATRSRHVSRATWLATSQREQEKRNERYANDPEYRAKYRAYQKEWQRKKRATDPEYAERCRTYQREWSRMRRAKGRVERLTRELEDARGALQQVEAAE